MDQEIVKTNQQLEKTKREIAIQKAITTGNVADLDVAGQMEYLIMRCEALGLDYRTGPLQYVSLSGRMVLYAGKSCSDQLIAKHGLSVSITSKKINREEGIIEAQARATRTDGTYVEDVGVVATTANMQGDALCNAIMKSVTKAKRRAVLSACGLGMLDESELETIPGAKKIQVQEDTTDRQITGKSEVYEKSEKYIRDAFERRDEKLIHELKTLIIGGKSTTDEEKSKLIELYTTLLQKLNEEKNYGNHGNQ